MAGGDGTDREQKYTSKGNGTFPSASRKAKQQAFAKAGQPTPPEFQDAPATTQMGPESGGGDMNALLNSLLGDAGGAGGDPGAQVGGPSASGSAPQMGATNQMDDNLPFGKAFRTARNGGMPIFTWRGKEYTTELADGGGSTPQAVEGRKKGQPAPAMKGQLNTGMPQEATAPTPAMDQAQAMGGAGIDQIMQWLGIGAGVGTGVAAGDAAMGAAEGARATDAHMPGAKAAAGANVGDVANYSAPERAAYKAIQQGDFATATQIAQKMQAVDPEAAAAIMQIAKNAQGATGIPKGISSALKALGL